MSLGCVKASNSPLRPILDFLLTLDLDTPGPGRPRRETACRLVVLAGFTAYHHGSVQLFFGTASLIATEFLVGPLKLRGSF